MPLQHTPAGLQDIFQQQRSGFMSQGAFDYKARMEMLDVLLALCREHADDVATAIISDFGARPRHEILISEIYTTVSGIRHIQKHLKDWMRPQNRAVPWMLMPGKAKVLFQPLGVVGIIAPWNYPFYLSLMPLATALGAGNRVMLKPSELTPRTADCLAQLLSSVFSPSQVAVVTGGPEVGAAFSGLAFDHILFTGSTSLGKIIMKAASANLTPVTLELGGKSPVIVSPEFSLTRAASHIAAAKWFNSGQTCVAPDYVLAPEEKIPDFVEEVKKILARFYPSLKHNPDYTAIINDKHYNRLNGLIQEARERGASIISLSCGQENLEPSDKKIPPTLVLNAPADTGLMTDEIFGPILPLVGYKNIADAVAYINARPRPLALYIFDDDRNRVDGVLHNTTSGTACINGVMLQVAVDDLPFGGVGASGMGLYHAREGFETFSHKKGVFFHGKTSGQFILHPPYTRALERALRFLINR